MEILGELAFVAFLVAMVRELYRWVHRGRQHAQQVLAVGGFIPKAERPRSRLAIRLFLGAGFFFLLYLIPTSAHATDLLADDLVEAGDGVTEEITGLSDVEEQIADPLAEIAEVGRSAEEAIRSTVEVVEDVISSPPTVPEDPLGGSMSPLPKGPEGGQQKPPSTSGRLPAGSDVGADVASRRVAGRGRDLAPLMASRERASAGAPSGVRRLVVSDGSLATLSEPPDVNPVGGPDLASTSTFVAGSPTSFPPVTGFFAVVVTSALLALTFLWRVCARRAQGYLCYLGPPVAPPG